MKLFLKMIEKWEKGNYIKCGTKKNIFLPSKEIKITWKKILKNELPLQSEIYYDPEIGYWMVNELKRKTGLHKKVIEEFLPKQDVYTRRKPIKRKFKRRRVYVPSVNN